MRRDCCRFEYVYLRQEDRADLCEARDAREALREEHECGVEES